MAQGMTRISDIVVPDIFTPYVQQITEEKSRLVQSGAVVADPSIDALLAGGGLTFHVPSWKDLENDEDRVSSDTPPTGFDPALTDEADDPAPNKIGTSTEIAVRLSRNNSWATADLTAALAGDDPADAIANAVARYWVRRRQAAFVATMKGVFANNALTTDAYHVQNDMVHDVSGTSFVDGVTNFTAEAFLDAALTMGDSQEDLSMVMVHSVVYNRMQKNNLIDFIPDARGEVMIPTFLGREVIVDDGMPFTNGVFDTWLFGAGAIRLGVGTPKVPTEIDRKAGAGNGGGADVLYNRVEWVLHPAGYSYVGTPPNGGPSNAATTNNLANANSWRRAFAERKMIKIARLVTREF